MITVGQTIRGVIRGGVAVLESGEAIPDGTVVDVVVREKKLGPVMEMTAEEREEYEGWERLSAEAWQKFLEWEKEQPE
jgi:hypothetical protein